VRLVALAWAKLVGLSNTPLVEGPLELAGLSPLEELLLLNLLPLQPVEPLLVSLARALESCESKMPCYIWTMSRENLGTAPESTMNFSLS
jgi:hypothetical protein